MKRVMDLLKKVFIYIFIIIFLIIIYGTIFDNKSLISEANPLVIILGTLLLITMLLLIRKIIFRNISDNISLKKELIITSILFLFIFIIQAYCLYYLKSNPGWDWNNVYSSAVAYANGYPEAIDWTYYKEFPNNYGLLYFEIIVFKFVYFCGKMHLSMDISFILNYIFIIVSEIMTYLTVRNILGKRNAIFSIFLISISAGFYMYLPVLYTDTVSMFIPITMLYLISQYSKSTIKKAKRIIILLLAFLATVGLYIKLTSVFLLLGLFVYLLIKNDYKKMIKPVLLFIVLFGILFSSEKFIESKLDIFPFDINHNEEQIPYTHWIMMGMTERDSWIEGKKWIGWYNPDSYQYTRSYKTTNERKKANIIKIKEQYKNYGFYDYIKFLYRKMLFVWSDGTFYAPAFLAEQPIIKKNNPLSDYFHINGKYIKITFIECTAVFIIYYLSFIVGILAYRKKNDFFLSTYISLFGILIFFLLWEASSRYLINYIPIMIICSVYGINEMCEKIKKNEVNIVNETIKNRELRIDIMKKETKLYIVIPCYNEEEVIHETTKRLKAKLKELIKSKVISKESRVMYVNDGSKDNTWKLIKEISEKEELFTGITLSRNRGHQNALVAGLLTAKNYADVIISMDADLQDDINAVDEMLAKYNDECDIVYGVRSARKKDTFFKRVTAEGFYNFMSMMGVDIVFNHADYRLTSKRVLDEFENYKEVNLFLRGIFPLIGFKSDIVYYERAERFAGESKYPLKKMLNFAWDGITSFSVKPLRMICTLGVTILFISIIIMLYSLIRKITGNTVDGWTFITISIWFIGGLQMLSLGIVGEYIGKMYNETKRRPRFIVSENLEEKINRQNR